MRTHFKVPQVINKFSTASLPKSHFLRKLTNELILLFFSFKMPKYDQINSDS